MEDFWLDKTKSDNWSFRFFIRHDLKRAIFRVSVRLRQKRLLSRYD
jgi:hypothetical protein